MSNKSIKLELQKLVKELTTAGIVFGAEEERKELNLDNDSEEALKVLEAATTKLNSFVEMYL